MPQEYREAELVVRARLVAETSAWDDEPSRAFRHRYGNSGSVIAYRLAVLDIFKGEPGSDVTLFEERNSGAFYIDTAKDYLLFLNYHPRSPGRPAAARGATYVRYACGQSKPWSTVRAAEMARLLRIAGPRRTRPRVRAPLGWGA